MKTVVSSHRTPEQADALKNAVLHPHVNVPTATLLLYDEKNPSRILVGKSKKHPLPVLPGGKIDAADLRHGSLEKAARACALREFDEEVGRERPAIHLLATTQDGARDVRLIPAGNLKETAAGSQLEGVDETSLVLAHYGVPDYLFIGALSGEKLSPSEELQELLWIDAREVEKEGLSAGHSFFVALYLRELDRRLSL